MSSGARSVDFDRRSFLVSIASKALIIVPALLAGLSAINAHAATGPRHAVPDTTRMAPAETPLRLAQSGDVEIYIDEYGRRVIVDSFTGEVLGIQRPRQNRDYRRQRRLRELNRDQGGFLLDDPDEDIPYRPRPYYQGRPVEEYPETPDEAFPEAPVEVYPDAPGAYPEEPQPRVVTREPIERQPLDGSVVTPGEVSPAPGEGPKEPGVIFAGREEVAGLQVLLDRKGASPGVIDGHFGSNVDKALAAYRDITGQNLHSTDSEAIKKALAESGGDTFTTYTITPEDAAGPFVASVPADYGHKAKLDRLSFTSVSEMLAERFHMDDAYLKALNPGAVFGRPGTVIKVANTGADVAAQVSRIIADKTRKQVRAYDVAGKLVAAYPATIGSSDTPSPTGTHEVARVAFNPEYTYNPNVNFKQGDNSQILTIPPGPNGPVGSIWIALSKPTYGIHGTPDPSKIGKTESHGCVRLTNWDAGELAKLVKPGVTVEFVE
jgi:lipoprotein-anchoring transpeptidase ErfK/SrfK